MLFNSLEFLIFLPIVFLLYWLIFRPAGKGNIWLLAASYLFYGWWDWRFLALIGAISGFSYAAGMLLQQWQAHRKRRQMVLWSTIIVCLGILAIFKYFDFFALEFSRVLRVLGMEADSVSLDLVLPVGISFYTFQAMSYVIDVYRRAIEPVRTPGPYFLYIAFFPQLVAGPIERAGNLIPQFQQPPAFNYSFAVSGLKLILWGFFKKVVVADGCAAIVPDIFDSYAAVGTMNLWLGAFLFTFQIYGDFSGYSDIAVGTARLFGIRLMQNFNLPYFSRDIVEFWQRWHRSLTGWLRDYLYIPLGGSRGKRSTTIRNTMVVFAASGLWHGAGLSYIAWGLYNAILFIPLRLSRHYRSRKEIVAKDRKLPAFSEVAFMGITFLLVMIGWVLFRSADLTSALDYIGLMFSHYTPSRALPQGYTALGWIALMLALEWWSRHREAPTFMPEGGLWRYRAIRWSFYMIIFACCCIGFSLPRSFIYFQF